eukprot:16596-Heterococcus_DN1.PRE.2
MVKTLGHRVLSPLALWKIVPNRRFDAATKRFDTLATGLIAQEKAKLAAAASAGTAANGSAKDSCLLTQLVQYGEGDAGDTAGAASESGPRNVLTSEEVLGNVKLFLAAGTDTVGGTIAWLLYDLCKHQDVQQKVRDEIIAVLTVSYSSAVSLTALYTSPSCTMPANDFRSLGHSSTDDITWDQSMTAVNEQYFSDAARFWPERWLIAAGKLPVPTDDTIDSAPFVHDAKALFLFGAGPRVCPGQQLALVMVKVRYTRTIASHRLALVACTASVDSATW